MRRLLAIPFVVAALFTGLSFAKEPEKKDGVTHVDAEGAAKLLAEKDDKKRPVILDIRTPEEFQEGHLEGAKNIDFKADDFSEKIARLDRDKPYVVHCRSGGRSGSSLEIFKKLGFKNIIHLDGGILGWQEAKLPTTKPKQ